MKGDRYPADWKAHRKADLCEIALGKKQSVG
jgi:hypothetical protein